MRTGRSDFLQPEHLIDLYVIKSAERFGLHCWEVLYDEGQSALRQTSTCAEVLLLESQPWVKVLSHCEFGSVHIKGIFFW